MSLLQKYSQHSTPDTSTTCAYCRPNLCGITSQANNRPNPTSARSREQCAEIGVKSNTRRKNMFLIQYYTQQLRLVRLALTWYQSINLDCHNRDHLLGQMFSQEAKPCSCSTTVLGHVVVHVQHCLKNVL